MPIFLENTTPLLYSTAAMDHHDGRNRKSDSDDKSTRSGTGVPLTADEDDAAKVRIDGDQVIDNHPTDGK